MNYYISNRLAFKINQDVKEKKWTNYEGESKGGWPPHHKITICHANAKNVLMNGAKRK